MSTLEDRVQKYREMKQHYEIFDVSIYWHPRLADAFIKYTEWGAQSAALSEAGITGGLITSDQAIRYDPYEGNDELLEIETGDEFSLCAVLTPDMFFNADQGVAYLQKLIRAGVVAARIFPGSYRHSTQAYCIGDMLDLLVEHELPLMVWHIDTGFDAIDRICADHPTLPVILDSMDRKLLYHMRDYGSLLKKHHNFHIETHNLVLFNEYEELYRIVGERQLLFGSYSPYASPDFSIYPILEADIPEEARRNILSGNARRMFKRGGIAR